MMLAGWWCNNHLEKYEFVNGKDDIPYMKWKIIHSRSKPLTIYIYIHVQYVEYIHEYIYSIPSNIPEISHFYYWYIILYIPKKSHYWYNLSVVSTAPLRAKASELGTIFSTLPCSPGSNPPHPGVERGLSLWSFRTIPIPATVFWRRSNYEIYIYMCIYIYTVHIYNIIYIVCIYIYTVCIYIYTVCIYIDMLYGDFRNNLLILQWNIGILRGLSRDFTWFNHQNLAST